HHDKVEVMRIFNEVNVPCGPVLGTQELIEDKNLAESGAVVEVDHPTRGSFKTVGSVIRLSDSPVDVEASPLLGADNTEIYGELGIAESELAELKSAGVI